MQEWVATVITPSSGELEREIGLLLEILRPLGTDLYPVRHEGNAMLAVPADRAVEARSLLGSAIQGGVLTRTSVEPIDNPSVEGWKKTARG
jgi:hypothetical protein